MSHFWNDPWLQPDPDPAGNWRVLVAATIVVIVALLTVVLW